MSRLSRLLAKWYAYWAGYFWEPCDSCGQMFGGHERSRTKHFDSIVVGQSGTVTRGRVICTGCTAAGVGCRSHAEYDVYHFACQYVTPPEGAWVGHVIE